MSPTNGPIFDQPSSGSGVPHDTPSSPPAGVLPAGTPGSAKASLSRAIGALLQSHPDWSVQLPNYPLWGQNTDWTWEGAPDLNHSLNCLPESLAQATMHLRGVELPANFVKDVMYGESYTGYTDFNHAMRFLDRVLHVSYRVVQAGDRESWLYWIWRALDHGHPHLGVYHFSAPDSDDYHVRGAVYMDSHTVKTADPWTASLRVEDYDTNYAWSAGYMLIIEAVRWQK